MKFIDENVDIKSKNIESVKKHVTQEVIEEYLKVWESVSPIKIVAGKGDDLLPSLPQFKGVTVVGVQTNVWIEPQKLLETINLFSAIVRKVKS